MPCTPTGFPSRKIKRVHRLAELDHDLREDAEERGLKFYRVPIPFDDPRIAEVLADLVEPLVRDGMQSDLRPCRCRERPGVYCLNNR